MSFAYELLVVVYLKKEEEKAYHADVEHTDHALMILQCSWPRNIQHSCGQALWFIQENKMGLIESFVDEIVN